MNLPNIRPFDRWKAAVSALVLAASLALPAAAAEPTYQYRAYTPGLQQATCALPWGGSILNGASVPGYTATSVAFEGSCTAVQTMVSCGAGSLLLNGAVSGTCSVAAESDPHWPKVTVLADFDGLSNGTTSFVDAKGNSFAPRGSGGQISTGASKVGGGSLFNWNTYASIDGAGSLCDLGSGDFTVEGWFYSTSSFSNMISCGDTWASQHTGWVLGRTGFQGWDVNGGVAGATASFDNYANAWHHLAAVRSGGSYRFFIDGNPVATSSGLVLRTPNSAFHLGGDTAGATGFSGNIDEIRVTRGVARYWNAFSPRASAYPKE